MTPADLAELWRGVNLHADALLNTSLIKDPDQSYIAVTMVRVWVIGICLLAARRITQLFRAIPRRRDESLRAYLKTPWWRRPALTIVTGLVGLAAMFFFQALAGNLDPGTNRLGSLTPYLLLANTFLGTAVYGLAEGAGAWRRQVRRPLAPALVLA